MNYAEVSFNRFLCIQNLQNLNAEHVRFVPWLPYPLLAVAEMTAPDVNPRCTAVDGKEKTSKSRNE